MWDYTHGMRDLNTMLDASGAGWSLMEARSIDNNGWIAGTGLDPAGRVHAYLLVPEPTSLIMLAVAGGTLLRRRGRLSS